MVAVLAVVANHLWGWPRGGFVGVDVFFVISGFLITGNLLRMAETKGTVSFTEFYWNRIRRIVPAATVVLLATYLVSLIVYLPFRSHAVGVDALFAFAFVSNWWFAHQDTDYFRAAAETVSPLQHYWSLSIEEQFYFVWPALIFVIGVVVVRRRWPHSRRMGIAGAVMVILVCGSLWWAMNETMTAPARAYFDTFARVWELGVGAILATAVGLLRQIPRAVKPVLSWAGLALIAGSFFLIGNDSVGFPFPWALLPVEGAALVIAAGVGGEPSFQGLLRNRVSTYLGDISYSLYLVHWPVIVLLGVLLDPGIYFYATVLSLTFALAVASYHFVENPLRKGGWPTRTVGLREFRRLRPEPRRSTAVAALAAGALLAVAGISYALVPVVPATSPEEVVNARAVDAPDAGASLGPATAALQGKIDAALQSPAWPVLDPTLDSLLGNDQLISPEVAACYPAAVADQAKCNYGSSTAPFKIVIVGDSVGAGYAEILRQMAEASNGQLLVLNQTMPSCVFTQDAIDREDVSPECPGRKDSAVDVINAVRPDAVLVSNGYERDSVVGTRGNVTSNQWVDSLNRIIGRFSASTTRIVLLAPPPSNESISECYGKRSSRPADCIGRIPAAWRTRAAAEQELAAKVGAAWVDSRPWFCGSGQSCPAFVGTTAARVDQVHMAPPYAGTVLPAFVESLRAAGVPLTG